MNNQTLITAVQAALNGDWNQSHNIVQAYDNPMANWLHAVLHKMEGDVWNSQYWYAKTSGKKYEDNSDITTELNQILDALNA